MKLSLSMVVLVLMLRYRLPDGSRLNSMKQNVALPKGTIYLHCLFSTFACPCQFFSEGPNSEGEVSPPLWDDVALLPEQAQQQVLCVLRPAVDPGALQPAGDMSLSHRHIDTDTHKHRDTNTQTHSHT
ncbi:hypothetical protein OYC64_005494 [Pagothenia borchgrevinki]|uniref:Secreted protein n=1 Tax=Pagothenia borchgrevinki TaxID=8213 RepID=A0ABD2GH25_PAGBO